MTARTLDNEPLDPKIGSPRRAAWPPSARSARQRQRRLLLAAPLAAPLALRAAPARAEGPLQPTPRQSKGPYYPLQVPRDAGSDLVIERDGRRAEGEIAIVEGVVRDTAGSPLTNASVEIWQCNARGRYHHPMDRAGAPIDPLFRAYGRTLTDAQGRYRFRTIRPVAYTGRTPHIHFQITTTRGGSLVTQLYVRGAPENAADGLLSGLSPADADRLLGDFVRQADGSWRVRFDPVLAA